MMYSALSDSEIRGPNARYENQRIQDIRDADETNPDNDRRQEMLKASSKTPNNSIMVTANRNDYVIRFNPDGTLDNDAPYRFGICDDTANPEQYGRIIEINTAGQIRITQIEPDDDDRGCAPTINS